MKRLFLSTICTLALVAFMGQSVVAQQETNQPSNTDNVIIIQKTQNDDGTWTVKKKSIQKGQSADTYVKEFDLKDDDGNSEVIVVTGDDAKVENANAETVIYIRSGKNKKEIKWDDTNGLNNLGNFDMSEFALIGHDDNDEDEGTAEKKAFLGVYPESNEGGGVLVTDIVPGSGAAAAGLRSGDVITAIDGAALRNQGDLSTTLTARQPGDAINITFLRDGQSLSTTAELSGRKKERHSFNYNYNYNYNHNYTYVYKNERGPCDVFIGVQIGVYGDGEKGVGVDGIIPGWPAEDAGLQAGDRIISIDGVPVNTHNELVVERDKHKPGEYFTIGYVRGGGESNVEAQFKVCPKDEQKVEEPIVEAAKPELPSIDNTLQLEELSAYPNPTAGNLNIKFKGEAVATTVTITDITGKVVYSERVPNFDGYYDRQVDVSKGAPGTLTVTIRQEGKLLTAPVVLLNRA